MVFFSTVKEAATKHLQQLDQIWKKRNTHLDEVNEVSGSPWLVCVCACVCARARARACMRACVRMCVRAYVRVLCVIL